MTLSRPDVRRLLASDGMRPSRALGQNFVVDPNTVRRIARLSGGGTRERGRGDRRGTRIADAWRLLRPERVSRLWRSIADSYRCSGQWWSLSVHESCTETRSASIGPSLLVFSGSVLVTDLSPAPGGSRGPWVLVANLPYNIATPLIAKVLDDVPEVTRLVVMVQREVGERLAAAAGDPAYGAVSVKVAYHATASLLGRVSPTVFMPRPKVESVIVGMERRATPGCRSVTGRAPSASSRW